MKDLEALAPPDMWWGLGAQESLVVAVVRTRAEAGRKAFKLQEGLPFLVGDAGARGPHRPLPGVERPLVV